MQALERWERALDEILTGRRRRLTGAEYVTLVDAIDRAGDVREVRTIALRLAEKLGRLDGRAGEARFADAAMARAYRAAQRGHPGTDSRAAPPDAPPLGGKPSTVASRRDLRPRPPM
jgi:hypothetical protein